MNQVFVWLLLRHAKRALTCRKLLAAVYVKLHEGFCVPAGQAGDSSDPTVAGVHFDSLQPQGGKRHSNILFSCSYAGQRFSHQDPLFGLSRGIRQARLCTWLAHMGLQCLVALVCQLINHTTAAHASTSASLLRSLQCSLQLTSCCGRSRVAIAKLVAHLNAWPERHNTPSIASPTAADVPDADNTPGNEAQVRSG